MNKDIKNILLAELGVIIGGIIWFLWFKSI